MWLSRLVSPESLPALTGRTLLLVAALAAASTATAEPRQTGSAAQDSGGRIEYRVLATTKTSTMNKELNEAAELGFRFEAFMGGETAFGGQEVVAVMMRTDAARGRYLYRLLATSKTSTLQRELQEAADAGFVYRGQTVFESLFGGREVVLILERDKDADLPPFDYRLIATSKTSTLQKELSSAGEAGYEIVGLTVGETAMGGKELVAITKRPRGRSQP